jgi:hypothetical protein
VLATRLLVSSSTRHDPTWWLLRHSAPRARSSSTSSQPSTRDRGRTAGEVKVLPTVVCR